ncbi:MAG: diacylglycerol kinase family lipid kinase [Herpetosiphon sp.]
MTESRSARIVFNPQAGNADAAEIEDALAVWRQAGWHTELCTTEYAGHAIELARSAVTAKLDLVIAAGGDGTINEVVNGLAGTTTPMAALPVGTGNVWIRELDLPLNPAAASTQLLAGAIHAIDLGQADGRYFLMMAGIGFDAAVTRNVAPTAKRRLGLVAYGIQALALARHVRGTHVRILLDGRPITGHVLMVLVGNSRLYGGFLQIAHHASPVDGLFDVIVIKGGDMRVAPLHLLSILLRQQHFNPDLGYYRAREVVIDGMQPLDVQVDGDTFTQTPIKLCVVPSALHILLPQHSWKLLTDPTSQRRPFLRALLRHVNRSAVPSAR